MFSLTIFLIWKIIKSQHLNISEDYIISAKATNHTMFHIDQWYRCPLLILNTPIRVGGFIHLQRAINKPMVACYDKIKTTVW
jgi:hypothetical protein